jgi:hypothetical protein
MIEKEELIQKGMGSLIMKIDIGEKIVMGHTVGMEDVIDKNQIIVINIVEIVQEINLIMKIIGIKETKGKFTKSVITKILVHIIGVIVCQILVTMDIKIVLVIVQYQLNKRILDIDYHLRNVVL